LACGAYARTLAELVADLVFAAHSAVDRGDVIARRLRPVKAATHLGAERAVARSPDAGRRRTVLQKGRRKKCFGRLGALLKTASMLLQNSKVGESSQRVTETKNVTVTFAIFACF
jgi:hypothetical protein